MKVILFKVVGKIKEINQKKVEAGEEFRKANCLPGFLPPRKVGTNYWEIILEECQTSPDFWDETHQKKVKLVFFDEKFQQNNFLKKEFAIGQKYSFNCVGGSGVYWPHFWEKEN